ISTGLPIRSDNTFSSLSIAFCISPLFCAGMTPTRNVSSVPELEQPTTANHKKRKIVPAANPRRTRLLSFFIEYDLQPTDGDKDLFMTTQTEHGTSRPWIGSCDSQLSPRQYRRQKGDGSPPETLVRSTEKRMLPPPATRRWRGNRIKYTFSI